MKKNLPGSIQLILVISSVLVTASAAQAQYAGTPGDVPQLPVASKLDVETQLPVLDVSDLPGISEHDLDLIAQSTEDDRIYNFSGASVYRIDYLSGCIYLFTGDWGVNVMEADNVAVVEHQSRSGRFYAAGADGTCTIRGPVYVVDLETGIRYCTTPGSIWGCSDWIEGDYLIMEHSGYSREVADMWQAGDIGSIPWISSTFGTEAFLSTSDLAVWNGLSSWIVLPEDEYYSYRPIGTPWETSDGIVFDVAASANVVPSMAGLSSYSDVSTWLDSVGYDDAFPTYGFRVFVDCRAWSVTDILPLDPYMVADGFLNSMSENDVWGLCDYVTQDLSDDLRNGSDEVTVNVTELYRSCRYRICGITVDGDTAEVISVVYMAGSRDICRLVLVRDRRWRVREIEFRGRHTR